MSKQIETENGFRKFGCMLSYSSRAAFLIDDALVQSPSPYHKYWFFREKWVLRFFFQILLLVKETSLRVKQSSTSTHVCSRFGNKQQQAHVLERHTLHTNQFSLRSFSFSFHTLFSSPSVEAMVEAEAKSKPKTFFGFVIKEFFCAGIERKNFPAVCVELFFVIW